MTKNGLALALGVLLAAGRAPFARAEFEEFSAGARPAGMGNAFVGLADDSRAAAFNPAGLAYLRRGELGADYGRLFAGMDDQSNLSTGYLAFVQPLSRRKSLDERVRDLRRLTAIQYQVETSTAAEKTEAKARGEKITFFKELGTLSLSISNLALSGVLSENIIRVGYGRTLLPRLAGGFAAKVLTQNYTQDAYTQKDPVFDQGGKSGLTRFSFDASVLYNLYPKVFLGTTITDLNRPNTALNSQDRELLPLGLKSGLAYRDKRLRTDVDVTARDGLYRVNGGGERWFKNNTYALRAGGGFGAKDYRNVTYGMSVNWGSIQLDYAFVYPLAGAKEIFGSHKFSFTYRFGKAPLEELEAGSLELYYSQLQAETEMLRSRLEKAEDERSRLEKVLVEEALSRIKEKVRAERLEATVKSGGRETAPRGGLLPALTGQEGASGGVKTYVTSKGDTLQSIAELFYGRKEKWIEIFNLNKDKVGRGGSLKVGTVLLIPASAAVPARSVEEMIGATPGQTLAPLRLAPLDKTGQPAGQESAAPIGAVLAPVKPGGKEPAAKPAPKAKEPARPKTYTVLPGETLSSIAQKVYGDAKRWKEIYNANKDKVERGSVSAGQVLTIPE